MPNFHSLYNNVSEIIIESTFPPDSICAWTSIYTGENPAEHGLIESIDYLSSKKPKDNEGRSANFKGKTFWDIASRNGKKVCIINPFIAYPAWEVNGVMVSGPVFEGGTISAYPESILAEYNFPAMGGIVEFPEEKELKGFLDHSKEITEQLADVGLKIHRDHNPDLFFITFLTLDRIKHFFWRFTDKNDVYYPGDNPFKDAIRSFYLVFDKIIAKFKNSMSEDTALIILSDHGHRRRCSKCLNLNEVLRKKGYIKTAGGIKSLIEKAKVTTLRSLSRYDLEDWIYRIARFVPKRKELRKSTYLMDKTSPVRLSNLCGANPYGGIEIKAHDKEEYERLREAITEILNDINIEHGDDIVKWVKRREDVYRGRNEDKLPDILFELDEDYGVGRDFFTRPITENYTHKKISGGHKSEAVFMLYSNCPENTTSPLFRALPFPSFRAKRGISLQMPLNIINLKKFILGIMDIEN